MTKRKRHRISDRPPRELRREELLDAAVRVVRRRGPGASMEEIAAEAGITKPILYRHFGDRGGLVDAVAGRFAQELTDQIAEAMRGEDHPRQILVAAVDSYLRFVETDPNILRFLVQRALTGEGQGQASLAGFIRQIGRDVTVVLGERLREIGRDSGAAEPWAFGIVGMVHLAGDWWTERGTMPRERLVSYLTDLLWNGMATAGVEQTASAESAPDVIEIKRGSA